MLFAVLSSAQANLVFNISEKNGNVRIDYSGTLDMSGMSFTDTNNALEEHSLRYITSSIPIFTPFTGFINLINAPGSRADLRTFSNPFSSGPSVYFSNNVVPVSSFGGTSIYLPTISSHINATLRFDPLDFVGNVWTGSGFLQWNNTTTALLGINTSPKTWVINNTAANTITMSLSPVPEPSSIILLVIGVAMIITRNQSFKRYASIQGLEQKNL